MQHYKTRLLRIVKPLFAPPGQRITPMATLSICLAFDINEGIDGLTNYAAPRLITEEPVATTCARFGGRGRLPVLDWRFLPCFSVFYELHSTHVLH